MNRGENDSVNFRGKEKGFAEVFYTSVLWRDTRRTYLESVHYLCEDCLARGLIKRAEEVHHKIKLTPENINNPEITLSWSNLRALCKDCHLNVHRKPKRWRVDENGEVTLKGPP